MSDYDAELIRAIPSKLRGVEWWRSFALSAIEDLTRAEARHRRHLARLRWRRTQRAEVNVNCREYRTSGPRPSSWSAYLAAEAAASGGES